MLILANMKSSSTFNTVFLENFRPGRFALVESLFCFQSLSQYERLAQTTGDQYENVTIPTTTKIPPKIQEKTRKNSSNLPPMPVRNQAEVSYATLELNPIENPTHGMFMWRNTAKKVLATIPRWLFE